VVLIVTAQDAESLLPTIVSRCEVLRLRPLPLEVIEQGLQARWGLDAQQARLLAHLSGGRPGYALSLAQDRSSLEQRQHWLEDHRRLLTADRVERLAYSESHSKEKEQLRHLLMVWLSLWRDVLLRASGTSAPLTNLDRDEEIQDLAAKVGMQSASGVVSALQRTLDLIDRNANVRLAMDVFMLDLPRTTVSVGV
jgi:DNA polymerase-3 subunit delta'